MMRNMFRFAFKAALAIVSAPLLVSLILIGNAQASTEKVIYSFGSGKDGSGPVSSLIFDTAGNLYGTTASGGAQNDGTVFELTPGSGGKWTESIIHSFTGGKDGLTPLGNLIMDAAGNLYGTTSRGAQGGGTVFILIPGAGGKWKLKVLHTFHGTTGGSPSAGLIFDTAGSLYGTTAEGGGQEAGTVFQLTPGTNGTWTFKTIHSFNTNGHDGTTPLAALTLDGAGNLYGTTSAGGSQRDGVVFQLTPGSNGKWTETILHTFDPANGRDGAEPVAPIIIGANGDLFGTTVTGGKNRFYGVVFELTLNSKGNWEESILHAFADGNDGGEPNAGLTLDADGNLYGTASSGGAAGGVVFKETLQTNGKWKYSIAHSFKNGTDGLRPYSGLILDAAGNLYGTTKQGGSNSLGTVFLVKP
jgi:uncharacterized repeat protein (TIGR03803 family)